MQGIRCPCGSVFRHVVGELHAEKVVHVRAERLFDAQGHFRRQHGLSAQEVGQRGAAHFQNIRCLRHVDAARAGRVALPIGLPVTLALAGPIDTATAAAGDPVAANVVRPVRRPDLSEELIPAGAVARGRIRRVEYHLSSKPYFLIAMAFNRVEVQGVVSPFVVRREADAELGDELGANLVIRETGIWFWGVGTFLFPTNKSRTVIPAGFESKSFTLATGGR